MFRFQISTLLKRCLNISHTSDFLGPVTVTIALSIGGYVITLIRYSESAAQKLCNVGCLVASNLSPEPFLVCFYKVAPS